MGASITVVLFALVLVGTGCGRKAPPLPPDILAPQALDFKEITGEVKGIRFSWRSPKHDRRGKELKSLDGYRVYRKDILERADIVNPDVPFQFVAALEDTSVTVREQLREQARAEGKIGRRIKEDPQLRNFEYLDTSVEPGKTYLYKLVPLNQGGVEGETKQFVKVLFRGVSSEISKVDNTSLDDELSNGESGQ